MHKQPLNYKIEFDGLPVTPDEQRDAFLSLVKLLLNLSAQSQLNKMKFSSQKDRLEHQFYINNYHQKFYKVLLQKTGKNALNTDYD